MRKSLKLIDIEATLSESTLRFVVNMQRLIDNYSNQPNNIFLNLDSKYPNEIMKSSLGFHLGFESAYKSSHLSAPLSKYYRNGKKYGNDSCSHINTAF